MVQKAWGWTILTSHGMVLFHLAADPSSTQRQLSDKLGLTERQIGRIVHDLSTAGIIRIERQGRHNIYTVNPDAALRHPTLAHISLRHLMAALVPRMVEQADEPTAQVGE